MTAISAWLAGYLSIIYQSSVCLSIYLSNLSSMYVSTCLCIYVSIYQSIIYLYYLPSIIYLFKPTTFVSVALSTVAGT